MRIKAAIFRERPREIYAGFLDVSGHPSPLALKDARNEEDPMGVLWFLDPFSEVGRNDLSATLRRGCPDSDAAVYVFHGVGAIVGSVLEILCRYS